MGKIGCARSSAGAGEERRAVQVRERAPVRRGSTNRRGDRPSLEPGARTGRTGRSKAPERILLLNRGARLSRGCPHFLLLCFFLRLLGNTALYNHGLWLVHVPSRKRFRWAGRHPRRIRIIFHDCLGWRLISGEPGIRSNGWLHQPKENEEKGRVGSYDNPGGPGQAAILVSRGARHIRIDPKIHPPPPSSTNSLVALGGREVQLPPYNRFFHQGGGRQISRRSGAGYGGAMGCALAGRYLSIRKGGRIATFRERRRRRAPDTQDRRQEATHSNPAFAGGQRRQDACTGA